jgi:membrane protein
MLGRKKATRVGQAPADGRPKPSVLDRVTAAKKVALARAERAPRPVLRIAMAFLRAIRDIEPFDRAMTLAAQAFVSIFPLLITWAAFVDNGNSSVGDEVADKLHLSESMRAALDQALPADTQQSAPFGVISLLIVLVSATSFSRALNRMYARAWHVAPSGWNNGGRWVAVIVAICATTVATQYVNQSAQDFTDNIGALLVTFLANTLLYAWVPWLLLMRRISAVRLLPSAALMGIGSVGLYLAGRLYLPHALKISTEHFGSLGAAFALIGWLFVAAFVLIVATVLGAVIVQDKGVEALVREVRRRVSELVHRIQS